MTDPHFSLCSVQLSDSIQRVLNEQSATHGLEIVYTDLEKTPYTAGSLLTSAHVEVRKACSRALKAFARTRVIPHVTDGVAVVDDFRDIYRAEAGFPYLSWQWQLGNLYFPHQPIKSKGMTGTTNSDIHAESYAHLLEACDRFSPGTKPIALSYNGYDGFKHASGGLFRWTKGIVEGSVGDITTIYGEDARQNLIPYLFPLHPLGKNGSFCNDQHTIGVTLERSSIFQLAGIPVNNSRVLVFHADYEGVTRETTGEVGSDSTAKLTSVRKVDIYLKYVKLARVWLNNVEVEQ